MLDGLRERLHRHVLRRLGHTQPGQPGESIRDLSQCEEHGLLELQPGLLPLRGGLFLSQASGAEGEHVHSQPGVAGDKGQNVLSTGRAGNHAKHS